jgi:serine/threonine protein kinase
MIGQTISHYRITGQLGSGGMGVVYEAQDLDLGRKVALKFLPPQLSRDQNALDRFLLEARAASALNHPNICTIYAVEKAGEQSFIAMELLEGETLDRRIPNTPMPLDRMLEWSIQLADALDAALTKHSKGFLLLDHRMARDAEHFSTRRTSSLTHESRSGFGARSAQTVRKPDTLLPCRLGMRFGNPGVHRANCVPVPIFSLAEQGSQITSVCVKGRQDRLGSLVAGTWNTKSI